MEQDRQTTSGNAQAGRGAGSPNGANGSAGHREDGGCTGQERGHEVSPRAAGQGSSDSRLAQGANSANVVLPAVDIFEDELGITVLADMPGVSKEQLTVRVTGDNLVIEGAMAAPVSGEMEILYGEVKNPHYHRSFTLSRELDPGKIEAKLTNGVLTLTVPKAEEARPRRIEVNVS